MVRDDITANDLAFIDAATATDVLANDTSLRLIEEFVRRFRAEFFTSDGGPDDATIDPNATVGEVVEALAREHFTPNWLLSYKYKDEVATLVRFDYDAETYPQLPFRQLHVRLFEDGTLEAHEEASALMHKAKHLDEYTLDRRRGTERVSEMLDRQGVPHERIDR